ncbi:MAG TPA: hypothetical protein VFG83_11420, partial [Kofleriaceae bacterium]|nr:hypothetical protein [Kofleriaceae bacterium]
MHLRLRALAVMDPRLWASVGLAALVACGGTAKPPAASTASAPHPSLPSPAFLDLIPADTAYAYMVIDPVDHGGVKSYLRRHEIAAALAGMKDYFSQHRSDMSTQPLVARLLLAAMSEADGDLASLGIDPSPRLAIWGMGLLPVARFELADGAKFRAFAERVFQRAGVHPTEETFQGTRYWLIEDSVDVVVAVIGDEVALSVFPPASKTAILPYVLGEKRPQRSLADVHALAEIQTAAGFEHPNLLGFINFVRAAEAFTTKDRGIHNGVWPGAQLFHDPACAREVPALFETMPRLIFGWEHHDADHISARIVLETRPDITERLARMVAAVPGLSTKATEGTAAAMGIGVDVGEVLDFIA